MKKEHITSEIFDLLSDQEAQLNSVWYSLEVFECFLASKPDKIQNCIFISKA